MPYFIDFIKGDLVQIAHHTSHITHHTSHITHITHHASYISGYSSIASLNPIEVKALPDLIALRILR